MKHFSLLLLLILGAVLIATLQIAPPLQGWQLGSLDSFRTHHPAHPDIAILAIDSTSLQQVGRWPWSRSTHAQIINKLQDYAPVAVGYDVLFASSESEIADDSLAKALSQSHFPVVLAAEAVYTQSSSTPRTMQQPLLSFQVPGVSLGQVNIPSRDGVAREFPQKVTVGGSAYEPFAKKLAQALQAAPFPSGQYLVNFAGPAGTIPTYHLSDLLNQTIPKSALEHKILLIGATASDLHDTVLVPENPPLMSGVEWHANILDNYLLQRPITVVPSVWPLLLELLIFLLFTSIRLSFPRRIWSLSATAVFLVLLSDLLWQFGLAFPYLVNLIVVLSGLVGQVLYRWYSTEKEKRYLRQTFQHYFSPQIMQAILQDPTRLRLGGQSQEVTILFSDIRSFTTITEGLEPEQLTALLQEYFTEMTEEILQTDGVIDKFIGDAIMAFWGAPIAQEDQAERAVQAARGMIKRLKVLQTKWLAKGYPLIDIGVGISTGVVIIGNMGSHKRFDYTIIGDEVNVAARLEGLNKEYKTTIIIAESTKKKLNETTEHCHFLGDVLVKGKTKTLKVYSVT